MLHKFTISRKLIKENVYMCVSVHYWKYYEAHQETAGRVTSPVGCHSTTVAKEDDKINSLK